MHKLSYQQGNSLAHKLYPLTKFFWLLAGSIVVFVIQDGRLLIMTAGLCFTVLLLIKKDILHIRGFRIACLTGFALFVIYLLSEKSGQILVYPGIDILKITSGGVMMGLRFSGRFLSIVFLSYIFIITTDPSDLAYALMNFGLPYRFGFMLVTALRLAPVLEDEGLTIYRAQLARGIRYDQLTIRKFILLFQQFMTPLLISALRRADKLVFSMEGRGFGIKPIRSYRKRPTTTLFDLTLSLCLVIYFSALLTINFRSAG